MNFWQYNKFWAALGGAIIVIATQFWGEAVGIKAKEIWTAVEVLILAVVVRQIPNAT